MIALTFWLCWLSFGVGCAITEWKISPVMRVAPWHTVILSCMFVTLLGLLNGPVTLDYEPLEVRFFGFTIWRNGDD